MPVNRPVIRDVTRQVISNVIRTGLPIPLLDMPLDGNLILRHGVGAATFTRSTTGTFVDKNDGLVKTAAIDAARFEADGVLIEGASTNLLFRSEEFDNASWAKGSTGAGTTPVVTANAGVAPDGSMTADRIQFAIGSNVLGDRSFIRQLVNTTADYDIAIYVKSNTGSNQEIAIQREGSTSSAFTVTNEWNRISLTRSFNGANFLGLELRGTTGSGDLTSDILVWGAQGEELPFASSYIKTTTIAVTRTADNLSITAVGNFNQAQGSISLDIILLAKNTANQFFYSVNDGTETHRHTMNRNVGAPSGQYFIQAGAVQMNQQPGDVPLKFNFVETYKVNDVRIFVNAAQVANDTSVTLPVGLTSIDIGRRVDNITYLFGHVKDLRTYDVVLTPSQVLAL